MVRELIATSTKLLVTKLKILYYSITLKKENQLLAGIDVHILTI